MDKKDLQKKLSQTYSTENWQEIVKFVFPNVSLREKPAILNVEARFQDIVESFKQLGDVKLHDGKTLALLELKVKENVNLIRNRVRLNEVVSSVIDTENANGVLSIFEKGTDDYRFTFSARGSEFDEEGGDFVTTKTDTRRFTYVLGKNESCKTPAQRFYELSEHKDKADIKAIEDAFSVEKLSKLFFKEYKDQYNAFVNYMMQTPSIFTAIYSNDDKAIRDFVKILLGRIIFIKFVQKKGWMGVDANAKKWIDGDYRFLENGFAHFKHQDLFYSTFLEPLFDALDEPNRPNDIFKVTNTRVPYLSGGLFELEDKKTKNINFPAKYFNDLFEFLDRYNFTIDENDTNDHEVGIDPEMLGHIFENLLEDNKDKGAFYTPKEIVRYMCQESLKEYLKTSLENNKQWPIDETEVKDFEQALHNFVTKKEAGGIIEFEETIARALKDVKICDPAIGSGAFPMGLLNEIFQLVHKLHDANKDKVERVWELKGWQPNLVKQNIIQNSIYGVDIEKGAVDVARLRFWLSLIVDEPEPKALPHLDYKIVVGNSLVSKLDDTIIDIDWNLDNTQHGLFGSELAQQRATILQDISDKQNAVFDPNCDEEKLSLEIRNLKIELLCKQLELMINNQNIPKEPKIIDYQNKLKAKFVQDQAKYFETVGWQQQITKLQKLKKNPNAPLCFFDWKLDFPEIMNEQVAKKSGFDIVIGNPPYVDSETMVANMPIEREYLKNNYETTTGNWDLFVVFIEKGLKLCNYYGNFSFIIPNKLISAKYTLTLREYISKKTISEIRDYSRINVFKEADVYPITINITNRKTSKPIRMTNMSSEINIKNSKLIENRIFNKDFYWDKFFSDDAVLEIILKLSNFNTISKYNKSNFLGAATVGEAYLIKEKIIENTIDNKGEFKKLINTGTIDKWVSLWGIKKTQYIKDSYSNPIIFCNDLNEINKTRLDQSNKQKIIIAGMSNKIEAFLDINGEYLAGKSTTILIDEIHNLKFINAILNSAIVSFFINTNYHSLKMSGGYLNIGNDILNNIPLPEINNNFKEKFINLVDEILEKKSKKNNETTNLEQQIDNLVYKLYELTYDEVLVVEPEFSARMSREEYEGLKVE
ncbi:MAG: Eco57I restriction-modification methylase domain-containing protein [Flavobacterium sp.]|nr:Eco57I restriction-modification methylase domain-containing protein [Flavobacterium sp.]